MTALEHVLFVLSAAVEKDEISKAELRRTLGEMLTASLDYEREDPVKMQNLSVRLGRRYRHVIYPNGIEEGEQ